MEPVYYETKPAVHLTPYISAYWVSKGFYRDTVMFPVFADGCCDIIYDRTEHIAKMVGTGAELAHVPLNGMVDMAGIRFRPGGFTALTGIPAGVIADGTFLSDILEKGLAEHISKQFEAATTEGFDRIFSGLINNLNPLIAFWLSESFAGIGDISDYFKCSEKTVSRAFLAHTGVSPVRMIAVKRFRHALELVLSEKKSMTEIAYDSGYCDQSHFIKDFRRFAGTRPSDFLRYKDSLGVRFIQFPSGCL
ncbi:helix-turn-helix domain-containing protein [Seleniivibrio woodruffii]|uniref:AraC family transcriptional regulator n=1 Tax=Seleniivibrio woodruffii TaxID=1078050 RepID=A0A4R1K8Y9_9BACT|nr:helix-turn-helix domain-containing protein [Seleniivibrio woodruffii]TCK60805.1 AraC family transcriptional regulator [Seleniivibrio woodruffii]TVZ36435.1 AraC-like DNA-binding protein [Seleniivibrio woodruffii]